MNKYFLASLIFAIFLALGHFLATGFGWYREYWMTDIILHTSSGVLSACIWIWLTEKHFSDRLFLACTSIVTTTLFAAFLWEVWEFGFWGIVPKIFHTYSPTLSDSLSDMSFGLLGGLIVSLFYWRRNRII